VHGSSEVSEARALLSTRSLPGVRDQHRALLQRAIDLAERALSPSEGTSLDAPSLEAAKWTLLQAHTARAEDARHGAGQLARGSQRAPTVDDCEDGWARVESIVLVSEVSARAASHLAGELETPRAQRLARRAGESAKKARQIVHDRNRAYTFHADPRFSFGEGWYLAAAAVLWRVPIQIEPEKAQTEQAERFLVEAGLGSLLLPHRPRPLANKALPDLIARAFCSDPAGAQAKLRTAFLGSQPIPQAIEDWAKPRLATALGKDKVLVWVRHGTHHPDRNTDHAELALLCEMVKARGLVPVLVGDALRGDELAGALDLTLFWKDALFQAGNMRRAQLELFESMRQAHGLVGQLGVTTAGMDGPALMGLPTMYLTQQPNVRLGKWVGAVPDYEEVVRQAGYLDRIAQTLGKWRDRQRKAP